MIKGFAFLLCMLAEGAVAALLGILLRKQFDLSRFSAGVRTGAAAVIGTGATHPIVWEGFAGLEEWTGTWRGAAALSAAGVVLVETLFYAAALRGHWLWCLVFSMAANAAGLAAVFLL
jgi:hypothetical protein